MFQGKIIVAGLTIGMLIIPLFVGAVVVKQQQSVISSACVGMVFSRDLKIMSSGTDVMCLQQLLNQDVDTEISLQGLGSRGKETSLFGGLTKSALIRFQEKYADEVLVPSKLKKGNGLVGPATRRKLNAILAIMPRSNSDNTELDLTANSVLSIEFKDTKEDDNEKVLFKKDENKKIYIASLTKLMTAVIVLDNYDLAQKVAIDDEDVYRGGWIKAGEFFSTKTLLDVSLIESDNSAAYALSKVMGKDKFVVLMNEKAKSFGLSDTYFDNSVGFGLKNYSTAKDLVKLSETLIKNYPMILKISSISEIEVYNFDGTFHHKAVNRNKLLVDPSINWKSRIIGGKTGSNELVKEHLILILDSADQKSYLINIVLKSDDRFVEMKKLVNWVIEKSK